MSVGDVQYRDRGLVTGLRDAVRALLYTDESTAWQAADGQIADALSAIGQARQLLESAEVALVAEGICRGLPGESSWSAHDWVGVSEGRRAPRPSTQHVAQVVRVASAGPATQEVRAAVSEGRLPLGKADQLMRFHESVRRVADPGLLQEDLGILLGVARDEVVTSGPGGRVTDRVGGLDEKKLAAAITQTGRMLRPEQDLDDEDAAAKASRSLTKAPGPCGMTRYRVDLDPEGAAILDAALAALAAPVKGPDGAPDERTPARRRADALLSIISRGVAAPEGVPRADKAQILVTISLHALASAVTDGCCVACGQDLPGHAPDATGQVFGGAAFDPPSGGHAGGLTATGQVLTPTTVRKLACTAGIIPAILGTDHEPLELGRTTRLFTPGQRKALWLRDGGCTYPGCTMPPQWTDAHHITHWAHGGTTDLSNAALLCERHHTHVHQHDLTATTTPRGVTWHT
ncbi:HNH endonuclease signature motif containing protein [Janibacter terrae]|uniref:HNH endonuclease signature motif containing protein n=1 Tax=Janibacter terrae TaxID=103817 RepID=UPI000B272525|nr:HNH endonuclease signature motif containing protein [Janibacter terrae]